MGSDLWLRTQALESIRPESQPLFRIPLAVYPSVMARSLRDLVSLSCNVVMIIILFSVFVRVKYHYVYKMRSTVPGTSHTTDCHPVTAFK